MTNEPAGSGRSLLEVVLLPASEHFADGSPLYRVQWKVDGEDLLDAVAAAELDNDDSRGPVGAGDYRGPYEASLAAPDGLRRVRAAREPEQAGLLYECSCGEWDCAAILVDVETVDETITWTNLRAGNAATTRPRPRPALSARRFAFDAGDYRAALANPTRSEGPVRAIPGRLKRLEQLRRRGISLRRTAEGTTASGPAGEE